MPNNLSRHRYSKNKRTKNSRANYKTGWSDGNRFFQHQKLAQKSFTELNEMTNETYRVVFSRDAKYENEVFEEFVYKSYEKLIAELTNAIQLAKDHELEWWTLEYASPELNKEQDEEIRQLKAKFVGALWKTEPNL